MRYMKLFEGFFKPNSLVMELEDICLELNDNDIHTECSWFPPLVILGTYVGGYISVGMESSAFLNDSDYTEPIVWNQVSEVVDRMIDFMEYKGWYLSSMIVDGDTLLEKQANYFIKTQSDYEFSGITFNFKEKKN